LRITLNGEPHDLAGPLTVTDLLVQLQIDTRRVAVEHNLTVLKRDGRHEEFSKEKLFSGIKKACQKRPISPKVIEDLVDRIVDEVTDKYEREVPAEVIGKLVMDGLRAIDEVAYVRFASVYRRFQEATDFVHEVKKLEAKQ